MSDDQITVDYGEWADLHKQLAQARNDIEDALAELALRDKELAQVWQERYRWQGLYETEYDIVRTVWQALGITGVQERTIGQIVSDLKADRDALQRELNTLKGIV